jgi:hypothetical protein
MAKSILFLFPIRLLSIIIFSFFIWWVIGIEGFALAVDCDSAVNADEGSYVLSSSCIVPAGETMIVVNGGLTINEGVTLTLDSNSRLVFEIGEMLITVNGNISLAAGATISEKGYSVERNFALGVNCDAICAATTTYNECVSIGQEQFATDGYYWKATACSGGSCQYVSGDCSTVMIAQCDPANTCCGITTYWTRCLCVE